MKECKFIDNLSAENTSDIFSTSIYCDDCFENMNIDDDEFSFVSVQDSYTNESCCNCGCFVPQE